MLNRLNMSTSFLALSLSLAVLAPLDMAMGMTPDQLAASEEKAKSCKIAAYQLAYRAYAKKDYERALFYADLSIKNGGSAASLILGKVSENPDAQKAYKLFLEETKTPDDTYGFYEKATKASDPALKDEAFFHVARTLYEGQKVKPDHKVAYQKFQEIIKNPTSLFQGAAQRYLNEMLYSGMEECRPAYEEAENFYKQYKEEELRETREEELQKQLLENNFKEEIGVDFSIMDKHDDFHKLADDYKAVGSTCPFQDARTFDEWRRTWDLLKSKHDEKTERNKNTYNLAVGKFQEIAKNEFNPFQNKAAGWLDALFEDADQDFVAARALYDALSNTQPVTRDDAVLCAHYRPAYDAFSRIAFRVANSLCHHRANLYMAEMCNRRQVSQTFKKAPKVRCLGKEEGKALCYKIRRGTDDTARHLAEFLLIRQKCLHIASYDDLDKIARDRSNPYAQQACLEAIKMCTGTTELDQRKLYKGYEQILGFQKIQSEHYKRYEQILGFGNGGSTSYYLFETAKMLRDGVGVPKDVDEARKRFQQVAEDGIDDHWQKKAFFELAKINYELKNYEPAYEGFTKAFTFGEPYKSQALVTLAKMNDHGWGCPLNHQMANNLLSSSNDDTARYKFASKYFAGCHEIQQNSMKARNILEGIKGYSPCQGKVYFKLGMLSLMELKEIKEDPFLGQNIKLCTSLQNRIVSYWKTAEEKGSGKASWKLAEMGLNGEIEDTELNHFKKACEGWVPEAWFQRGLRSIFGNGLPKNLDEALNSFTKFFPEKSSYGTDNRCKKMPSFLKKWILLIGSPQWSDLFQCSDVTKKIMWLDLLLQGNPDGKKAIQ